MSLIQAREFKKKISIKISIKFNKEKIEMIEISEH